MLADDKAKVVDLSARRVERQQEEHAQAVEREFAATAEANGFGVERFREIVDRLADWPITAVPAPGSEVRSDVDQHDQGAPLVEAVTRLTAEHDPARR